MRHHEPRSFTSSCALSPEATDAPRRHRHTRLEDSQTMFRPGLDIKMPDSELARGAWPEMDEDGHRKATKGPSAPAGGMMDDLHR